MPIVDMLVDSASKHAIMSFMDGNAGYNQIFLKDEDIHKTTFRCPGAIGTFEWVVMPFGLKNAGATYQRAMNLIFHDMIGKFLEVYIDDVVVKSEDYQKHVEQLETTFIRMRKHRLKMNPLKCAFGVSKGNFLGFLVHQKGIEIDKNKAKAIINAKLPSNKKELQRFLGKVNFLRRFIANLAGKTKAFSVLLGMKGDTEYRWEAEQQSAFQSIKEYLTKPPVLMPPKIGRPLKLYVSVAESSLGILLAQENDQGFEQAIYYFSRGLNVTEQKYTVIEKLCLTLYSTAVKLRHYMLPFDVLVIAQTDLIKYMLSRPVLRGKMGKWVLALIEYNLTYVPQKAMKGQALADFLASHPCNNPEDGVIYVGIAPWRMTFDGSKISPGAGAGIVLISPDGNIHQFAFQIEKDCSNNQAEYEALIIGLEILLDMHITTVQISGDSQLVIKKLNKEFKCNAPGLEMCFSIATYLLAKFDDVTITHIPRINNSSANVMAQLASGLKVPEGVDGQWANGQAEATNKSIKHIMERAIEDSPNEWHRLLSEVLWAFQTSPRSSTGITPYALTYGHDHVLPMEITVKSFRVAMQNSLLVAEYNEAMAIKLEELDNH
ncbi:hypothetical protein RJ640_000047 [Escallonia rubra]|uniref:RNase H type-1 domain-containing protein n=1 Tax=Escallonia rubra TaxID=112253 RepID=A0AA88S3W8_9ASTE|nr:hypothetical protein RJ640_000047 [Escallonia rubra]